MILTMSQPGSKAMSCPSQGSPVGSLLRNRLWRAALALTRCPEDAEDLTQQTLATVLARCPENLGHVGYVRRTMLHIWLDEQRSMRRRIRRIATIALSKRSVRLDRDGLADAELFDLVQRAIDTLPPQQHAVVVLRLIEGLDYDDIASTLACSVEAIRASLHLARRTIRRMIGVPP